MGFLSRLNFLGTVVFGVAILGLIWFRIVDPHLLPMLAEGGDYHGPLSSTIMNLEPVVFTVIGLLLVGAFFWFVVSSAREETSRRPDRPRRPR